MDGTDTQYKALNRAESNDIIVNKIWARNGSVSVVNEALAGCYCSSEFPLFRPDHDRLEPKWFYWITKTRWFWHSCDKKSRGTSGKNRIKPHKFLEIDIPLPPLDEQRRIVARIESLAARIDEAKRLREAIQADTDSLLVAMAHRNDLSDKEKQAQGWERVALGEVLTQVSDPVEVEPGEEYPHFGIYSFAKGLFKKPPLLGDEIKASKLYRVHKGQFIYSRLKAFEGAFGVVSSEYDGCYVSNEFPTFDLDKNRINLSFLIAYTKSPQVWKAFAVHSKGVGARRERLKPVNFLAEEIWLPPIKWQQKIKAIADRLTATRVDREAAGRQLDALLPAILDRAFKGEL